MIHVAVRRAGARAGWFLFYFGHLVRLVRFQIIGGLFAAFGLVVALAEPGLIPGMTIFWTGIGTLFLLSGGLTYWRYIRQHPTVAEAP
jgi:hypothetical protein